MEKKKGINFRPQSVSLIFKETGIEKLLDIIEPIDFRDAFYADKPEILRRIEELSHLLKVDDLRGKYGKIRDEIRRYDPSKADMLTLVILNFLEVTESMDEKIRSFEDGRYRIYTKELHHWKVIEEKTILLFLSELAQKTGIGRSEALRKATIDELKYQFDLLAQVTTPEENPKIAKINLKNGTFVVSKNGMKLREHRANDYFNYILPFDYDPEAKCPMFQNFLDHAIPEKQCQLMLGEFAGYPLSRGLKMEKALVLFGPGGTGKSTFQICISRMYGEENIGPHSLTSLCGTKDSCSFNRADLKNYVLNYSTEMGGKDCDPHIVKKVISREPVEARKPYGEPFILRNYCPVMFNVNEMPPMENSSAQRRRVYIAPFINPIPESAMDVEYADKIADKELSGIFNWALEGLKRLMTNKKFTISPLGRSVAQRLWVENDNVLAFLEASNYVSDSESYEYSKVLYEKYKEFCKDNNYRQLSCIRFLRRLEELRISVDRKAPNHQIRVYCKVAGDEQREMDQIREDKLNQVLKNI